MMRRAATKTLSSTTAVLLSLACWASPSSATGPAFVSAEAAMEHGFGAYKSGYWDMAIPALEFAAERRNFFAEFYLATMLADTATPHADEARAYQLFLKIADLHEEIDPIDDRRAPFVARALTMLAGYQLRGVREMRLAPDRERAIANLEIAATLYGDQDAQFELTRQFLDAPRPGSDDLSHARSWLATLAQEGHTGAQALLAEQLWEGRHIPKDAARALGLIDMAVETASAQDRVWIEEIHQKIYCGAEERTRKKAVGLVAVWKRFFHVRERKDTAMGLGGPEAQPTRTCRDGRPVKPLPNNSASEVFRSDGIDRSGRREVGIREPGR
jgi:TPR repeat protein